MHHASETSKHASTVPAGGWSPRTHAAIERALNGLSINATRRFYDAWSLMFQEVIQPAKKGVVESFTECIKKCTAGNGTAGNGAAARGHWDDLWGMWGITRGYPIQLDHHKIAMALQRVHGSALAEEYLRRATAFEHDWSKREAESAKTGT